MEKIFRDWKNVQKYTPLTVQSLYEKREKMLYSYAEIVYNKK